MISSAIKRQIIEPIHQAIGVVTDRIMGFWFDDGSGSIDNPWNDSNTWDEL